MSVAEIGFVTPVLDRLGAGVAREHVPVGIAHHDGAVERAQPLQALDRLRPALNHVTQADEPIDRPPLEIGQEGVERDRVAVDVGEEADPH